MLRRLTLPEGLVILAVVATIAWIVKPDIMARWNASAAQSELAAFTPGLTLGMTRAEVHERFVSRNSRFLTIRDFDTNLTTVETPWGFVDNWIAYLDFTDGRLASIRIRTADGMHHKPDGSPPDTGVPPPRRN